MTEKLCAVSVDLDPLTAYYQIHGLGQPPSPLKATIMRRVLPRFAELLDEVGIRATFFIVGRELEQSQEAQTLVSGLSEAGHELGNHTYSHPYDLCRLPAETIAEEVDRAHEVIAATIGAQRAPQGFRSPGYFVNSKVVAALVARGYRYDSSMFPSPPYYMAKIGVMALMALRGRRSEAVVADPRGLVAPPDPYRPDPDRPWARGAAPLVELPVAVLPGSRVPAIGTLVAAGPPWLRRFALAGIRRRPLFNLELHGIDLADAVADRIPTELAGRQPDLRIPFSEKRRVFLDTLSELKRHYRFVTLAEAATAWSTKV